MISTIYFNIHRECKKKTFIVPNNEYGSTYKSSFTLFLLRNITLSLIEERPDACILCFKKSGSFGINHCRMVFKVIFTEHLHILALEPQWDLGGTQHHLKSLHCQLI